MKLFIFIMALLSLGCTGSTTKPTEAPVDSASVKQKAQEAFDKFESKSATLYDGKGQWGVANYGYRMVLRDNYWRLDTYDRLNASGKFGSQYSHYVTEIRDYLIGAQKSGGSGVFGVPADIQNPEFGSTIKSVLSSCPSCAVNGWLINLPAAVGQDNLYYDHGYALYTLAKLYLKTPSSELATSIQQGADWAAAQPTTWNINYLSALAKGLSYAYRALNTQSYLDRAVELHTSVIFPHQLDSGLWDDSHNQQLEYHGFIVSGLIALRKSVPANHSVITQLDASLEKAVKVLRERDLTEAATAESTWLGTNLLAWIELSELRTLTVDEKKAMERVVQLITTNSTQVLSETGFRLQKGLYVNFILGMYLAGEY